jgi:hypothetical protein
VRHENHRLEARATRTACRILFAVLLLGAARFASADEKGWFAFDPPPVDLADSPIDLRSLNEKAAGDGGFIGVSGGRFVHRNTGEPLRFWAVNGPPDEMKDPELLQQLARMLAKRGVNQIRIHAGYFDENGNVDPARVKRAQAVVAAMKSAGIYTDFSTYYILFMQPRPGTSWLPGYDGKQNPFAALFFYPPLQEKYRSWWKGLLLTPDASGHRLIDDPAVSSLEMCNEDSYFFWTFGADHLPDPELKILEAQFGDWAKAKYGTLPLALAHWRHLRVDRDDPDEGRLGFRPLWNMFNERTVRDQDTAAFLVESERKFYADTYAFLRSIGFKGVITASNWITASPKFFDPLERYVYTVGDYLDRHGYFDCDEKGDGSEWSMRNGHTFIDRDALRFDPAEPGKPPAFSNPVMSIHFDDKPSTISETMFNRPNRYRSEMPLYNACYGALQGNDGTVFFALDGSTWSVKPGYFMQPWTVMTPGIMGQFPAAALIFRKGLVRTPPPVASVNLKLADLLDLQGTPLPQSASGDEPDCIDPLVHYVGPTAVRITEDGGPTRMVVLNYFINRAHSTVRSINGDLSLDFGKGVMTIRAPAAQGASGALAAAGKIDLPDVSISSPLQLGNIVITALDGKPINESSRMLLQVMSEEKAADFQTESAGDGRLRIVNIGHDPWLVKELAGEIHFKRPDAAGLRATPLDFNGVPNGSPQPAADLHLDPHTVYYLIEAVK